MLQKVESPLELIGQIPTSRALTKARERHEEARRAEEAAAAEFRSHLHRVNTAGRWVERDPDAKKAESEAIRLGAATRLAAAESEAIRRLHGEQITKHLAKHEGACLETLTDALREAHEISRKITKALRAAERDGGHPGLKLRKVRRIESELRQMLARIA
jgi:hypothetical protein